MLTGDRFGGGCTGSQMRMQTSYHRRGAQLSQVFMLYDTFGFPVEITQEVAAERGIACDMDGFQQAMDAQRALSQAGAVAIDLTADDYLAKAGFLASLLPAPAAPSLRHPVPAALYLWSLLPAWPPPSLRLQVSVPDAAYACARACPRSLLPAQTAVGECLPLGGLRACLAGS